MCAPLPIPHPPATGHSVFQPRGAGLHGRRSPRVALVPNLQACKSDGTSTQGLRSLTDLTSYNRSFQTPGSRGVRWGAGIRDWRRDDCAAQTVISDGRLIDTCGATSPASCGCA